MAFDAPRFIIDIVDVYIAALVVIIIGVVEQTDTSKCCTVYSTLAQVRKKNAQVYDFMYFGVWKACITVHW